MLGFLPLSTAPLSSIPPLALVLLGEAGSYTVAGQAAALSPTFALSAGSYTVAGQDARLGITLSLVADPGAYNLIGYPAITTVVRVRRSVRVIADDTGSKIVVYFDDTGG